MLETARREKILVAMSGGVDSSVAAWLLKKQGHDLIGVNMRTHRLTPDEAALGTRIKTCCSPTDAHDARSCATQTDFPFYVLDVETDFQRDVVDPFVAAYLRGQTPNPCVLCNNHVKLGLLLEKAALWNCDRIATGHYARKVWMEESGRWTLARPGDRAKDQTYYLFGLKQDQLEKLLLPLGDLSKSEVRQLAREAGLATAEKPESQEICFIPSNDYRDFLRKRFAAGGVEMPTGRFLSVDGAELGQHEGIAFYTVGQRRGLGVAGREPLYVVEIDAPNNNIILGPRGAVASTGLIAGDLNWMAVGTIDRPTRALVQIRYRHPAAPATIDPPDPEGRVRIRFDQPQQAVSPGQATVFYTEHECVLGGGWIVRGFTEGNSH